MTIKQFYDPKVPQILWSARLNMAIMLHTCLYAFTIINAEKKMCASQINLNFGQRENC